MKIINRIMISSAFLVLLSLISLLSVIGVTIWLFTLNGDGGKELLDKDIFHAEEILGGFDVSTRDWEMLNDKLSIYGYNLLVLKDDNIVFTALSDLQNEVIDGLKNLEPEQGALAGKSVDFTFVTMIAGDFSMYAIKSSADHSGGVLGFLQQLLLLFLVLILVILLLSQLFTRKLAWRILNPLSALSEGAKRIERGDLSKPLTYTGNDEFASVCAAFNHMQEHLIKEREKNTAYEKARVDLVAGISHDLRTPLTSIKGYIKGLRDGVANTPEKRENYLRIAYQKSCEMDVLLQKLFYYSNLETGNLPLSLADVDLGCFVRDFVAACTEELGQKNITITTDITSVGHPVRIDEEQMRRVMTNLIENAVKYADSEPLLLHISVWRERDKEHLLFADNGQGVPEEDLPFLFDRFWRGDKARNIKNGESNGLGLYIVKYIVEMHGGAVTAKNDNGLNIEMMLPCGEEKEHG